MREGEPHFEEQPATKPFSTGETLKEGEFSIRELKDNPDKIVRTESMVGSVEQTVAHYNTIKDRFAAMRGDYGVNVPDMDIVLGESEPGKPSVFMIVDKITGKDLGELKSLPEDAKEKFEAFYKNFLQSIFDGYKSSKPFYRDIKTGNIMYGHKSKEKEAEDDFFLTDVGGGFQDGNFIEFHGQMIETDYNEAFFRSMINAKADLQEYERKFGENTELKGIREKLGEIYKYCTDNKQQELEAFFTKDPTAKNDFEGLERQNEKESIWQKKMEELEAAADGMGLGIDKKVMEIIAGLNLLGFPTSQSCEGHMRWGTPNPWVRISAPNEPKEFIGQDKIYEEVATKYGVTTEEAERSFPGKGKEAWLEAQKTITKQGETPEHKQWRAENRRLKKEAGKLLKKFYKDRRTLPYVQLKIDENPEGDFEIKNGSSKDQPFHFLKKKLSKEQTVARKKRMVKCQQEMRDFGKFIKGEYFAE